MTVNIIYSQIAQELNVANAQVAAACQLLDEGSTVPFIARYRKEVTGGLDDNQLRLLAERLDYLRELTARKTSILKSIQEQGKLTPALEAAINTAPTKTLLEDLYLPYKPKRRTKAQIAKEAGLEPLALALLNNPEQAPQHLAGNFINLAASIADIKDALEGAKHILIELFSETAPLLEKLRQQQQEHAFVEVRVAKGKETQASKFQDYFDYREAWKKIPSHRALAIFRGEKENVLVVSLKHPDEDIAHPCIGIIAAQFSIADRKRSADAWLLSVVAAAWQQKLSKQIETDLMGHLREQAEAEAIQVFARNLKDLLLAAPAGQKITLGLDPGLRTGVKVVVLDATGQVLDHCAIFPHQPHNKIVEAASVVLKLLKKYQVQLIAIGNGTASRETEKFIADIMKAQPELNVQKIVVSEAGASVYSASELAAKEFPELDVTIRGAISIGRRLQDPLAELVKIDPKAIGVGQYQHDVSQTHLARSLDAVVEDCVNAVGVEVNTASAPLLARVAGLNVTIANNIVAFRNEKGAFKNRQQLLKVPRLGAKAFEQAAGFLRIHKAQNPLDASGVHPESYSLVETIAAKHQRSISALIGDSSFLRSLKPSDYANAQFGVPTITDILKELDKPGRDPRPEFKTAQFKEGIEKLTDVEPGMILQGVITNVTNFGAFVDIGVHQDGLVHISMLSHQFVKDPHAVVKAGDIVSVKVMEVDAARKRIALSMRLDDAPGQPTAKPQTQRSAAQPRTDAASPSGTMAALFNQALQKKK
ncbi:MAG TPA: Tex family protein [Cellvibrionaceae bacterium]